MTTKTRAKERLERQKNKGREGTLKIVGKAREVGKKGSTSVGKRRGDIQGRVWFKSIGGK